MANVHNGQVEECCAHAHTREEYRESSHCLYVPSTWERESDDDPYETVTVRDTYVFCTDCGECVECITGA